MRNLRNTLLGGLFLLLWLVAAFTLGACGNGGNSAQSFDTVAARQLETFTSSFSTTEAPALSTIVSANYSDVLTVESYWLENRVTIWSTPNNLTREANYILTAYPLKNYQVTILSSTAIGAANREVSFAVNFSGKGVQFPVFNFAGRAFGTALFAQENNVWMIKNIRLHRGALALLVDADISGGHNATPKISLAVINFSKDVILGEALGSYFFPQIPYPEEGVNNFITVEASGLGAASVEGSGAIYPFGGYSFGYNRPAEGIYPVSINVHTPENETISLHFNCVVNAVTLEIE